VRYSAFVALAMFTSSALFAAEDIADALRPKLENRVLTLKHFYKTNKQRYDAQGEFKGKSDETDWTQGSMFQIAQVKMHDGRLELRGHRIITGCNAGISHPQLVKSADVLTVQLELPDNATEADGRAALDKVFSDREETLTRVPRYFRAHYDELMTGNWNPVVSAAYKVGGAVKPPTVIRAVNPKFDEPGQDQRVSGTVLLAILIDEAGRVNNVEVICALTPEMTENAIKAAEQWQFHPATKDGVPVPVRAQIEAKFDLR
jgi:TonB family protein